jgi:hypothetical protein
VPLEWRQRTPHLTRNPLCPNPLHWLLRIINDYVKLAPGMCPLMFDAERGNHVSPLEPAWNAEEEPRAGMRNGRPTPGAPGSYCGFTDSQAFRNASTWSRTFRRTAPGTSSVGGRFLSSQPESHVVAQAARHVEGTAGLNPFCSQTT